MPTMETVKAKNGYVSVKVHWEDARKIAQHAIDLGIKEVLSPEKLHATLFYSEIDCQPMASIDPEKVYLGSINGNVEKLGDGEWGALAHLVDSPDLLQRFEEIKEESRGRHSYPDLKVHISVKYSPTEEEIELLKANPLRMGSIRFVDETQKDIRE